MTAAEHVSLRRRLLRLLLPVLILGLAFAAAARLVATKPQHQAVIVKEKAWLVAVQAAEPRDLAPELTLYARIESQWSTQLTTGITADVTEVLASEGDLVEQDAVLVRLDERDTRLLLAQREADLQELRAKIAAEDIRYQTDSEALPRERELLALTRNEEVRLRDLVSKKVGAQSQLDSARQAMQHQAISLAAREQAVAEHDTRLAELIARQGRAESLRDQAALELERCQVRAPFNARIAQVLAAPGKRVRVGDPLLQLYDTDKLLLRGQIPTRYLALVRSALVQGQPLLVAGELDGRVVDGRLRGLAGEANTATGGIDGLFDILGDHTGLHQGRFARLRMTLPTQRQVLALPPEAIYGTDRIYYVDSDDRMRAFGVRRVGDVRDDSGDAWVLVQADGLEPNSRIVTTQLPNAIDGLLVRTAGQG